MTNQPEKTAPQKASPPPDHVPLVGIARETEELRPQLIEALSRVVRSGHFVLGPVVEELERQIARMVGAEHAVGCASGSDALLLALMALDVGPGDEVIVPSYTFFATASAPWRLGARVVFADIEPTGFTLDVDDVARRITPRTKAIVPVHLFGQCADMPRLRQLAREHRLHLIEDAAQAIGAALEQGAAGSLGTVGCFSFYPTKNLGGLGDGGMLTTGDAELAQRLRLFRLHGMEPRYHHSVVGINSRLDALQAAALLVKLQRLEQWTAWRAQNAARYEQLFRQLGLAAWLTLPAVLPGRKHVWNQYVVRVPAAHRDPLRRYLADQGVSTEIYYPVPLHRQPCFASVGGEPLPETERAARETIALPIFPHLQAHEQQYVVECIARYVERHCRGESGAAA